MKRLLLFFLCQSYLNAFSQHIIVKTIPTESMGKFNVSGTELVKNIHFADKNGTNYLLATLEEAAKDDYTTRTLWVEHFVESATGKLKLLREIKDFENECPVDNQLSVIEDSFLVTDLDKNGYAEVMFMYKTGCKGDVSPSGLKLIILQNGSKAAIRGKTRIRGFDYPKEKVPDAAFLKLPAMIQAQAHALWKRFEFEY